MRKPEPVKRRTLQCHSRAADLSCSRQIDDGGRGAQRLQVAGSGAVASWSWRERAAVRNTAAARRRYAPAVSTLRCDAAKSTEIQDACERPSTARMGARRRLRGG